VFQMRKKILELGSGLKPYKGKKEEVVIHLDVKKLPHVEVVHDLNKFPWPFKNNEFDEIIAKNVLEHLNDLVEVMKEIWRILKPGGIVKIWVPYFAHPNSVTDPTHKIFFTLHTFDYFDPTTDFGEMYSHEVSKIRFNIVKKKLIFRGPLKFVEPIFTLHPNLYEIVFSRIFPADEIYFELQVIK